jgi:hypothetical protein
MRQQIALVGSAIAALLLGVRLAAAQPPTIVNTTLTTRTIGASLDRELAAAVAATTDATWFAWSVPSSDTGRGPCCWSGSDDEYLRCGCQLEEGRAARTSGTAGATGAAGEAGTASTAGSAGVAAAPGARPGPVRLEGSRRLVVLARVENRAIQKFAAYSADCDLDAGGRPVVWLEGVKPSDSVAYLATSVNDTAAVQSSGRTSRIVDTQLLALSLHADPGAIPALIQLAKAAPVAHVRSQSLFWLAQRAGAKVLSTITGAIENDPDTEVKVRAVFALSQLPKDESVPLLIGLARANKNPQVRKQAMFWLGQSKDPRALAFFEEILTK